nr:MAG TPA: hypothetical protein [Caudoviricetes sp.]
MILIFSIIVHSKLEINPFMKKFFFSELLSFGDRNFTSSKIKKSPLSRRLFSNDAM